MRKFTTTFSFLSGLVPRFEFVRGLKILWGQFQTDSLFFVQTSFACYLRVYHNRIVLARVFSLNLVVVNFGKRL